MTFTKQTAERKAPWLLVLITLPTVLILITGCQKVTPEPVKTTELKPAEVKPAEAGLTEAEPRSTVSLYDKCAAILKNCVDDKGMVDYKTLKRKKPELSHLLDEFAKLDPHEYNSWTKEDKIAFWINAYNIKMLKIIVDSYPIQSQRILRVIWGPDSIRHIDGIWDKYKFIVMKEEFTLKEIEQRFFYKEFNEPQAFLAISYASLSGPPLRNEPYYGPKLYEQLGDQAKKFLSSPLAFSIDREKRIVYISAVFQPSWHGKYFLDKYGTDKKFKDQQPEVAAVLNFLTNYISQQDVSFLDLENYSVEFIRYDWTINDSP
ncbi:MAG: DUF547 domain-containing protein [Sedimentisphaerales bacterium]